MANNCDTEKRYVIQEVSGIPGPQGPQGPPGPPGPGATLPIAAGDISVTNPGFANLQELLDYLLYVEQEINSFGLSKSVYEIGSVVTLLNFSWVLNKNPLTQQLSGDNITTQNYGPATRNDSLVPAPNITGVNVGDSFSWTLQVDDGITQPTRNTSLAFYNGVYWGDAPIPGVIDSNWIRTTFSKSIQAGRGRNFTSNAGVGEYAWYAHRSALGTANFAAGGFPGGFEAPTVVSFVNALGFVENYNVYRSTNPAIGPVAIIVS
jgi:hypothetical protein